MPNIGSKTIETNTYRFKDSHSSLFFYIRVAKQLGTKLLNNETVRFIIAGSANTLFCYVIFTISLFCGLERTWAMSVATLATILVSFLVMGYYVFECGLTLRRFVMFFAMQGMGYVLNISLLTLISKSGVSDYLSGLISLLATAFVTFFMSKYVVFFKPITKQKVDKENG